MMTERKVFTETMLARMDSDIFLDMPLSAQLLYFHLSIRANNNGYVNNPKSITKSVRCTEDDLQLLISKDFIFRTEDGIAITDMCNESVGGLRISSAFPDAEWVDTLDKIGKLVDGLGFDKSDKDIREDERELDILADLQSDVRNLVKTMRKIICWGYNDGEKQNPEDDGMNGYF